MDLKGRPPRPRPEYDVSNPSVAPRPALPRGVVVLTVLAHPRRGWLDRWMPSWAASLVCTVAIYLLIVGLALAVVVSVARFATLLPQYAEEFQQRIDDLTAWLNN